MFSESGEKYKIDVTDRFVVEFYLDSELQCELKLAKKDKIIVKVP